MWLICPYGETDILILISNRIGQNWRKILPKVICTCIFIMQSYLLRHYLTTRMPNSCTPPLSVLCHKKYSSPLISLYFSNMVKWICPKLLTVFLTTWLLYFLKIVRFSDFLRGLGGSGWPVRWVGLPAWVSRPEHPKGAKDEVRARRAPN